MPQIVPYLVVKRAVENMLEYLDYIDSENSILGKKEIPTSYYERLESLHATIKKLDEKGKHGQTIESENIRYIYYKTC